MNGPLNGFLLNGVVFDPVVRTQVNSTAAAVCLSKPRVLVYARVQSAPAAQATGSLGRVLARLVVSSAAQAAVSGIVGRVHARLAVALTGSAQGEFTLSGVRAAVSVVAAAAICIAAGVFVRSKVNARAQALVNLVPRRLVRSVLTSSPNARTAVVATVLERTFHRAPLAAVMQAQVEVDFHVDVREPLSGRALATATVVARSCIRAPVAATAQADITVDFDVIKRIPFDEPAPEERRFLVEQRPPTFYVVN